jgi:hypothetical protein
MTIRVVLAVVLALILGALGYRFISEQSATAQQSPLLVMLTQMRTRALIEHERSITVWYRTCPEVTGVNPEVLVIWPAKLSYELDLAASQLKLNGDVLEVSAPAIRADEPSVPTELAQYVANSSIWTLPSEQDLVLAEMQKATPLARHLSGYFLAHDPKLEQQFREELEEFLRGMANALQVPVKRIVVTIAKSDVAVPLRPAMQLCPGANALANGLAFARAQPDGTTIGVYPKP